jgi:hypothetical protein
MLRFVELLANSVWQTTTLLGKAGRLWVNPLLKTKAEVYDGIAMTTLSSNVEAVDWDIENLTVSEL